MSNWIYLPPPRKVTSLFYGTERTANTYSTSLFTGAMLHWASSPPFSNSIISSVKQRSRVKDTDPSSSKTL